MSKNLLILSLIVLTLNTAFCQVKIDSSATWTIASISMGNYYKNETFMAGGDTLINSILYKSVSKTSDSIFDPLNSTYFCAIRETNNEWYIIPSQDSIEHLLYDFNVIQGDTVTTYNMSEGDVDLIVFKIDSILLNDKFYKRIELGVYDFTGGQDWIEYWIEGIGSTNGFYMPAFHVFDIGFDLLCFYRNDSLIYNNSPDGTCGYIKVGIENKSLDSEIKISPNPVTNFLNIESKKDLVIRIYSLNGKKILSTDNKRIDIFNLKCGIYQVKIFDKNNKLLKTQKILKK